MKQTDTERRATPKQLAYIQGLNRQLGGMPVRFASQLQIYLPLRLRNVDLNTATKRQASEIIQRLIDARGKGENAPIAHRHRRRGSRRR